MTKKTKGKVAQRTLFKTAARELGADESKERFDAALKAVARHKPTPETPKKAKQD